MKRFKRALSLILMVSLVTTSSNIFAYAADANSTKKSDSDSSTSLYDVAVPSEVKLEENTDSSHQYFAFDESGQKIDSNGNFTFSFSWSMDSTSFRPASSSLTLYARATCTSTNKSYNIDLYRIDPTDDTLVKAVSFTANDTSQQYTFTGLDTSESYFLRFSKPFWNTGTVTGSGQITPIQ